VILDELPRNALNNVDRNVLQAIAAKAEKAGVHKCRSCTFATNATRRAVGLARRPEQINPISQQKRRTVPAVSIAGLACWGWPRRVHFSLNAFLGFYHVRFACLGNVDQHFSAAGLVEPSRLGRQKAAF
jgi:hypothetical protein